MLLSTPPRSRHAEMPSRFARPCLEALEARDAPANVSIAITYGTGCNINIQGDLTATSTPGNQLININGMVNTQVVTDAQGHYSHNATPNQLGTVYAYKTDGGSNYAAAQISDMAPVITQLDAIEGAGGVWTIQGTVTYHRSFESLTVVIDGVPVSINATERTAGSDGQFSWAVQLNGTSTDNGSVWAEAISPWGLISTKRFDDIHQTGT